MVRIFENVGAGSTVVWGLGGLVGVLRERAGMRDKDPFAQILGLVAPWRWPRWNLTRQEKKLA